MKKIALVLMLLLLPLSALGQSYSRGLAAYNRGNYFAAIQEWEPLAEQGDSSAQFSLGHMYEFGQGVPQDHAEAVSWYRLAAEQGAAIAQFSLANMYDRGHGVPQDHVEAVLWYRRSAEQGYASAQNSLASSFLWGRGVPQDNAEAVRWYRAAAEQGYATSQAMLASMYNVGRGVPQDFTEVVRWSRAAAEQGNVLGQFILGVMHKNGRGVEQDFVSAVRWLQAAAEQGYARAQANLGNMYELGQGVTEDEVTAHMWLNIAASSGFNPAAELRDALGRRMSPADITEAQRRARTCLESDYQDCAAPLKQADIVRLRESIEACWNIGDISSESLNVVMTIGFELSIDSRPVPETIRIVGTQGGGPAAQRTAFEAARRAIEECGVNGYGLPWELYDQWRWIEITFNPAGTSR